MPIADIQLLVLGCNMPLLALALLVRSSIQAIDPTAFQEAVLRLENLNE